MNLIGDITPSERAAKIKYGKYGTSKNKAMKYDPYITLTVILNVLSSS